MRKYKSKNRVKNNNNVNLDEVAKAMTFAEYYDLMIAPALKFVTNDYAQKLGTAFVKWLALGKKPRFKDEGSKLIWNCLMLACNREFNPLMNDATAAELQKAFANKKAKSFIDTVIDEMVNG